MFKNNNNYYERTKEKLKNVEQKIQNGVEQVKTNVRKTTNAVQPGINSIKQKGSNTIQDVKEASKNLTNSIKSSYVVRSVQGFTEEFERSNSMTARFIFIIFIFILFGLFFRLGVYILTLFYIPAKSPIIIKGMRQTNTEKIYNVNPNQYDPKPILRSINQNQGMEFTWSTWIMINSVDYPDENPRLFFSKGKSVDSFDSSPSKKEFVMNSPGLYLYDPITKTGKTNCLSVVVSFFEKLNTNSNTLKPYDIISINNIPMKKWINVIIRVHGRVVDIYINGTLTKRKQYDLVIKQNYGDIYTGSNYYGVDGYISSLRYFDYAIGNNLIQDIMYNGPNLKMVETEMTETQPPYLAMKWYLNDVDPTVTI